MCENLTVEAGDVIEFNGSEGTGKSELLMAIAAQCILPKSLSGCGRDVIYINTDHKFDIVRFVTIVEQKVKKGNGNLNPLLLDSILDHFGFICQ